ncbi:S9 family peptidase [Shewanella avicenniae]|uniref:S9 family peptidase n=1 Tax=Shewanella avicenniae TaxID=2814294 RepID=A0ABX7QTF3_9GAMM|nr:prolyl oligopeptidase family serine peptidase [Shewanella avicenniae]QSX34185.1 S9 family peptidase [Shewanella avicenniae]
MKLAGFIHLAACALLVLSVKLFAATDVPSLADFLAPQDHLDAALSPDGRYLAQLWYRDSDKTRFVSVRDLSQPEWPVIGRLGGNIQRPIGIKWGNKSRLLIYMRVPFKPEKVQAAAKEPDFDPDNFDSFDRLMAIDPTMENATVLMGDTRLSFNRRVTDIRNLLRDDPRHLMMTAFSHNRLCLYKVDLYDGSAEKVAEGDRFTYALMSDHNGKPLFKLNYLPIAKEIQLFEYKKNDWQKTLNIELDEEDNSDLDDLVGTYEGLFVYRKRNKDTGFYQLTAFDTDLNKDVVLAADPNHDILQPLFEYGSYQINGYVIDDDTPIVKLFDPEAQRQQQQLAQLLPNLDLRYTSVTDDGKQMVLSVSNTETPPIFYLYDEQSGKLKLINYGFSKQSSKALGFSATFDYQSRDQQQIHALLLLPPNYQDGSQYPLIMMPHGGPQANVGLQYDTFAQMLATRGYVVMQPNFRGSTGYGLAFEQAGYRQWGQRMQQDLDDGAQALIRQGIVAKGQACLVGWNYGGYAALMGVIETPELYRCAVSFSGITDLPEYVERLADGYETDAQRQKFVYDRIGDPDKDKQMLKRYSPIHLVDKVNGAALLIASKLSDKARFNALDDFADVAAKLHKPVSLINLDDVAKDKQTDSVLRLYNRVFDFLGQHLNNPVPASTSPANTH